MELSERSLGNWTSLANELLYSNLSSQAKMTYWALSQILFQDKKTGKIKIIKPSLRFLSKVASISEWGVKKGIKELRASRVIDVLDRSKIFKTNIYKINKRKDWLLEQCINKNEEKEGKMDKEKETDNLSSCSPTTRETGNPSSCSPTTREVVSNYPVGGEQLHIKTPYNKTPNNKTHIYSSKMLLQVFDTWNEQKIVTHRSNYQGLKRIPTQIKIILSNDYSVQDIEQAIRNFRDVLKSEDTFWTHRWTLEKFLEWDRLFEFFPDQFEIETWLKFSTKKKQEKNAKRHSKINPKEDLNWYEKTMIYRGEKDEVRSNKNEASKDIYVAKERISVLEKPGGL